MMPAREAIIAAARSLVGLRGQALADALCPSGIVGVTPADVAGAVERFSTCELAAAAVIRSAFGLPAPEPYVIGSAAQVLGADITKGVPWLAVPGGALRRPTLITPPQPGDGIWYAPAAGGRPPEHVDACVTHAAPVLGMHLAIGVIAGGMPDGSGHYSAIGEEARTIVWVPARNVWHDPATGRDVWCVIDADMLATLYPRRDDRPTDPPPSANGWEDTTPSNMGTP